VRRSAEQLARTVDALVASARYEAGAPRGTADAFAVAAEAAAEYEGVTVVPPTRTIRLGVDDELAERILQPILENACRYGRGSVQVTIGRENGAAVYVVQDDGPGVAEGERERIFEPGVRGSSEGDGAGLGLALARRLARSVRGDVEAAPGEGGRFLVRLPTA
jgi:signal transduction histidine kinase